MEVKDIKLDLIDEPDIKDRLEVDEDYIRDLAESIKNVGLLHPICVAKNGDRFEIVSGDCRYLAFKLLERDSIPSTIRDISKREIHIIRATENLASRDLSPIEEGVIYNRLHSDLGMSYADIGRMVTHTGGYVKRRIKLLDFDDRITLALHSKLMTVGVAEELMRIGDVSRREYLTEMAIEHGVTVAVARMWVEDYQKSIRGQSSDVGGGGSILDIEDSGISYVSCNLCSGPMVLGSERILRICPDCFNTLRSIREKIPDKKGGD